MQPLAARVSQDWPGLKVVPNMSAGASDERLGVESFYKGNEFFHQYLRALTGS
jgi:hypothetical protein